MIGMTTTVRNFNKPGSSRFGDHSFCDFTTVMIIIMIIMKTMMTIVSYQDEMSFRGSLKDVSLGLDS
jgi:hypothetical protein